MDQYLFFFQPNVNNIQGSIQPSLIQCVFSIPIDTNTLNFLSNVNATNVNISNIANSQLNVFLDMLQGSTNGEFDYFSTHKKIWLLFDSDIYLDLRTGLLGLFLSTFAGLQIQ